MSDKTPPYHNPEPFNGHKLLSILVPHDGMIYAGNLFHGEKWGIECENRNDALRIVACVNACAGITDPVATLAEVRGLLTDYMRDAEIGTAADKAPEYSMRDDEARRYIAARAILAKLGKG